MEYELTIVHSGTSATQANGHAFNGSGANPAAIPLSSAKQTCFQFQSESKLAIDRLNRSRNGSSSAMSDELELLVFIG